MSTETGAPIRVLIAEDEEHLGAILEHFLRGRGYAVTMCRDGRAALTALHAAPFDVALIDIVMPEMDGLEVLRHLQNEPAPPEVIIITGNGTIDTAITAIRLGAYDYISKPYRMAEIDVMVRRAWEKRELGKTNAMLRLRAPEIPLEMTSGNPMMKAVLDRLPELAASDVPVIIHGERGTGKSYLARHLHALSGRARDSLVEVRRVGGRLSGPSVLVGRQGVPAGDSATAGSLVNGAFLAADRGTTIIDVDALDSQARVLVRDVIAEKSFVRLGGSLRLPLATRLVICADDSPYSIELAAALGVEQLRIPPLRLRQEDLQSLATQILAGQDGAAHSIAAEALEVLTSYTWPGNVRELRVVLARCSLLASREVISAGDLRLLLATGAVGVEGRGAPLSDLEKLHIEAMLVRFHWHQGRAAEALGISTKTLYRKMREFGFRRPRKRKLARVRPDG